MRRLRFFIIPFLLLALGGCGKASHPSDDVLLRNFKRHEADFERLLTMLRADKKLKNVDDGWAQPEDPSSIGVMPERIRSYRKLFSTLGIPRGFCAFHDPERFEFIASTRGLSITGSAKGYAYMQDKPDLVVTTLIRIGRQMGSHLRLIATSKGNGIFSMTMRIDRTSADA